MLLFYPLLMMNRIILFLVTISLTACINKEQQKDLNDFFNEKELQEINHLTSFVRQQIMDSCAADFENCVQQYFKDFEQQDLSSQEVDYRIAKAEQLQLLESLDQDVFQEIWGYCEGSMASEIEGERVNVKSVCINAQGKFAELLKYRTDAVDTLRIYGEAFEYVNDYTPSMNALLLLQSHRFDYSSDIDFLLISVHLLTLNHPDLILSSN